MALFFLFGEWEALFLQEMDIYRRITVLDGVGQCLLWEWTPVLLLPAMVL